MVRAQSEQESTFEVGGLPRRVKSAQRVAEVLDLLAMSEQPLRHAQVAEALQIPKSSASNLLDTLAEVRLITKSERGFELGVRLIELGRAAAERLDVRSVARPFMQELSNLGVATCNLAMLQGGDVAYLEKVSNPTNPIQIATRVGGLLPAHAAAMGKVLVASLPSEEKARWLAAQEFAALTPHTITDVKVFERELAAVLTDGYAVDDQESYQDVTCVAAPVSDYTQTVRYAISLTCLRTDVESRGIESIAKAVMQAASKISDALGAS